MKFIGFNFKKINVEKLSDSFKNLKINTNLDISDIEKISSDVLKTKEEIIEVKFKYLIDYEPKIAKVDFEGVVLITVEPKIAKDILKKWESKEILEEVKIPLFNFIIRKASIKALQFEDDMNLPSHIPFPSLRKQEAKD